MKPGEADARVLLDIMRDNYDMIWQETWYEFADVTHQLVRDFYSIDSKQADNIFQMIDECDDCLNQEQWFDLSDDVGMFIFELAKKNHFIDDLVEDYPEFYGRE